MYEYRNLLVSSLAAVVARILTHPLDTLKTRSQISSNNESLLYTLQKILALESFWALYKGLGIALLFNVPALTVFLNTYDLAKYLISFHTGLSSKSFLNHMISGCLAEIVSGFLWTPMEVIKIKLQASTAKVFEFHEEETLGLANTGSTKCSRYDTVQTTAGTIRNILAVEGVAGFFKGYWLSLMVFIPNSMIYFVSYEYFKSLFFSLAFPNSTPNAIPATLLAASIYALSAILSCTVAAAISNIPDVIKTRWQVLDQHEREEYGSSLAMVIHMWRTEGGLFAFTQGIGARIAYITPSMVTSMTIFDLLKRS
ncbi:mitochondrial carrier [Basidiobolus meristosporus CBS 931.73]|uniref:Mitochondrial carrier n=1 Tax=Basidiobolus meristosporus CBS 931.73 TaxID=1314790 RepID=A0A1Y1Z8E7_9FUNG|nr:mitochondrial carrier [Basidiobolus meristosporus CBS 931.73]|eukprot:ORY06486.1 mitochondrial carrier [Basidiobolus meristosporus CBS 931.73]